MAYNVGMPTHHQLRQERFALIDWMATQGFSHALTLNTDRELSAKKLKSIMSTFCLEFDRGVHGRNLRRVAKSTRLHAIAFPENLSTNAHLHASADLAAAIAVLGSEGQTLTLARTCWLTATNGAGSFDHKIAPDRGWSLYSTKRFDGTYFLSADFWPH